VQNPIFPINPLDDPLQHFQYITATELQHDSHKKLHKTKPNETEVSFMQYGSETHQAYSIRPGPAMG